MKQFSFVFLGILIGFGSLLGYFFVNQSTTAQKITRSQFEYCAINAGYIPYTSDNQPVITGVVNICYFQNEGCRNEEVKTELPISKFLQDFRLENSVQSRNLASSKAKENAYIKATAKLGIEGWELVSQPQIGLDSATPNVQGNFTITEGSKNFQPNIYFKRLKAQ